MPIIANTTSSNTFSAVRAQLNSVTKRMNQFAINESAIYANTITANSTLRISGGVIANGSLGTSNYVLRTNGTTVYWAPGGGSTAQYLQVANAAATYQTKAVERAALANTNAYIGAQATRITLVNTNLTGTNTALRSLISDRLQVANASAVYQTKAVERAALANTNSSIATQATRINLINTNLTGTNTALRTLISDVLQVANAAAVYQTKAIERAALANTNSYIAAQATRITLVNTNLTGTNTALRTLISDRLQVANASTLYATKASPTTSGVLAHTGRATISTNLTVSGNTSIAGFKANNSLGSAGQVLKTNGSSVYWDAASSSGGSTTQYLQVANAVATYATKVSPTTSGLLAHTGRATISTNLYVVGNTVLGSASAVTDRTVINGLTVANGQLSVSGNTVLSGTLVANSSSGTAGYYLRSSGSGIFWSPAAAPNRVISYTDQSSITINADTTDTATQTYTGAAGTLTINAPTGTLVNGQKILFRLTTTNAQTLSFNAIFRGSTDLILPTTSSGSSKTDYLAFIYNSAASKWDLLAKNFGY
jgi:hypothetical protein